jgi:hypothetical protein
MDMARIYLRGRQGQQEGCRCTANSIRHPRYISHEMNAGKVSKMQMWTWQLRLKSSRQACQKQAGMCTTIISSRRHTSHHYTNYDTNKLQV